MNDIQQLLHSCLSFGCALAGVKFLRFWYSSRDRFFLWLVAAFWVFSVGWSIRVFVAIDREDTQYAYLPRLLAFVLIIAAILDKNRRKT